jgi:hypothetical protein
LNGEAGEVVTPAGNPESATATEPLNPFSPAIETVRLELDIPAFVVMALGDSAMLKFGAVPTVNASAVEWVRDPELAVAVTV